MSALHLPIRSLFGSLLFHSSVSLVSRRSALKPFYVLDRGYKALNDLMHSWAVLPVPASANSTQLGRQSTLGNFNAFLAEQAMIVRVDKPSFGLASVSFSALKSPSFWDQSSLWEQRGFKWIFSWNGPYEREAKGGAYSGAWSKVHGLTTMLDE